MAADPKLTVANRANRSAAEMRTGEQGSAGESGRSVPAALGFRGFLAQFPKGSEKKAKRILGHPVRGNNRPAGYILSQVRVRGKP